MSDDLPSLFDQPITTPILPYAGTSGWSGTETSRDRATRADRDGTTKRRQNEALRLLAEAGRNGLTVKDFREITGNHHGSASSVLSILHKDGRIARLAETRDGCKIYVDLGYVESRPIETQKRKATHLCPNCGTEVA